MSEKDDKPVLTLVEDLAEKTAETPAQVPVATGTLSDESLRLRAKKDYVFGGKSVKDLSETYGVSMTTIRYWRDKEDWEVQKKQADELREDFQKALVMTKDPNVNLSDLKHLTMRKALNVLLLSSTKLEHILTKQGELLDSLPLAGEVQKLVGAVEKFIAADIKHTTGGVEQKNVTHTHVHLDVNEAMKLVQEFRRKGTKITVEEAMNILQANSATPKRVN